MKKHWEQIKKFYETYKIIIWLFPIFGGALYDRFVNMWNVPEKLEGYRIEFIEQRKKDSIMFANHLIELHIKQSKDSIHFLQLEKQLTKPKSNGNKVNMVNSKTNLSRRRKR